MMSFHPFPSRLLSGRRAMLIGMILLANSQIKRTEARADGLAAAPYVQVDNPVPDRNQTVLDSFAPTVQKVARSVVEVAVTGHSSARQSLGETLQPFHRALAQRQFGLNDPNDFRAPEPHDIGSGVIVSADGYILTNDHVVANARKIRVTLADGRVLPGHIVGVDAKTDVALLKINARDLPALPIADSDAVSVGDVVLAVGDPFGIGQTVTQGIVGAKDRVTSGDMDEDFIQMDAAINPGNSGGALVDVAGRLVGITTSILAHTTGNRGIGFAIPSQMCQWVMAKLMKSGRVERGYFGVEVQRLTPLLLPAFKLDRVNGALVAEVRPGSPAESGKLQSGDVIRKFDGLDVRDDNQFKLLVAQTPPGTHVPVEVVRDGEPKSLTVVLGTLPDPNASMPEPKAAARQEPLAGVAVADLDASNRIDCHVPDSVNGALVTDVNPDSSAYDAGLRAGEVITEINRGPVKSAGDAIAIAHKSEGDSVLIKIWSRQGSRFLMVQEND